MRSRHALVTGANRGLGLALVQALLARGDRVVATCRHPGKATGLNRLAGTHPGRLHVLPLDVASPASQAELAKELPLVLRNEPESGGGRLDLLVNNAARFLRRPILETTDDDFDALFAVNVRPAFRFARAALPHLIETRGCIVNVASISGLVGMPNQSVYAMTKGAIVQLTRQLAIECASHGVRVNAVAPGAVDTDFTAEARATDPDPAATLATTLANHPIGRMSTPDEVARAIAFLASPESGAITGTILSVDGGYVAR